MIATAALVGAVTFYVHTFVGGRRVAAPLLADQNLPKESKWLNYYCWHIVTILIAMMAIGLALVAMGRASSDLAWFIGISSLLLSVLSAAVATKGDIAPYRFPSTTLFAAIGGLAIGGLLI